MKKTFSFLLISMIISLALDLPVLAAYIDIDGSRKQATDNDGRPKNGLETYFDEDNRSQVLLSKDGDSDGKLDHFIDTDKDGDVDKYWDPDDNILSDVYVYNINNSGVDDWSFDHDGDGIFSRYYDPETDLIKKEMNATDLSLVKTASNRTLAGGSVKYTLTLTNNGAATVQNISVNSPLAEGLSYSSHAASIGTYSSGSHIWSLNSLSAGENATLEINAIVQNNVCRPIRDIASTISYTPTSTTPDFFALNQNIADASDASFVGMTDLEILGNMFWPTTESYIFNRDDRVIDFNGDGYADLLLNAFGNSELALSAGKHYIVFGGPTGWAKDVEIDDAAGASFLGSQSDELIWGAMFGNFNGDAYGDSFIFSPNVDELGPDTGKALLYFGQDSGWQKDVNINDVISASFFTEPPHHQSFWSNQVGDLNNDGLDDLILNGSRNANDRGKLYIVLGKTTGWEIDTELGTSSDGSFVGENINEGFPGTEMSVGDYNNDGYDDFVVGVAYNSEGANNAGQAYLVFGKDGGWGKDLNIGTSSDASFLGEGSGDLVFRNYNLLDINGDNIDDLAITALWNDEGNTNAGQTYIIFGKTSGWAMDTELGTSSDASFLGEGNGDNAVWISSGFDLNGDGLHDFAINSYQNDEAASNAGQVYIIFGKTSGWTMDTDLGTGADASFLGEGEDDGIQIGSNGDFNGDGFDDMVFFSYANDGNTGKSYLVLGKENGWTMDTELSTRADASFVGETAGDFAYCPSFYGDINGDGYDDLSCEAPYNNQNGTASGKIYLIFGRESEAWLTDTNPADNYAIAPDIMVECPSAPPPPSTPVMIRKNDPDKHQPAEPNKKNEDILNDIQEKKHEDASKSDSEKTTMEKPPVIDIAIDITKKAGQIIASNGGLFYIDPIKLISIDISRPAKVFEIMKQGLGATHNFIVETITFPARLLGKILLDVENNGEAYYINPADSLKYYLGKPEDAFELFKNFAK